MNMPPRLVALDVSHEAISSLKEYAILNRFVNVVALEVSHNEMCPYLASAAVLLLSHSSTAADKEESLNELARLARLCRLDATYTTLRMLPPPHRRVRSSSPTHLAGAATTGGREGVPKFRRSSTLLALPEGPVIMPANSKERNSK